MQHKAFAQQDADDFEDEDGYDEEQGDYDEDQEYEEDQIDSPDAGLAEDAEEENPKEVTRLDYHDFRSFSEGTLKKTLESIKASGEDNQFYLQQELQAHFKNFNLPTIQIDLIQVSDQVRPVYGETYPQQTIPRKARDLLDVDHRDSDPTRFEADDDEDFNFKANYDMLSNVFKSGIGRNTEKFKNQSIFQYEIDRQQKPIRAFQVTKTYDSKKNRWKNGYDFDSDSELSRREQLQKISTDMTVNYKFSVNEVKLNSGLNADVLQAFSRADIDGGASEFDLVQPFVADYELNHRQLAVYMINCDALDCVDTHQKNWAQLTEIVKDTPITFVYYSSKKNIEAHNLAKQVDLYAKAVIERTESIFNTDANYAKEVQFLGPALRDLDKYLEEIVFPDINRFKRALIGFKFKSPLNFIMIGEDFHEFFGMFYHAKLLAQYLTNMLTDSVFSLHGLHQKSRAEGQFVQRHDYEVKHAAAIAMKNSLRHKIAQAVDMLVEYNYLLTADQIDCSVYFPSDRLSTKERSFDHDDEDDRIEAMGNAPYLQCWARKYGGTLFSLLGIAVTGAVVFYCAISEMRKQKTETTTRLTDLNE